MFRLKFPPKTRLRNEWTGGWQGGGVKVQTENENQMNKISGRKQAKYMH